MKRTSFHIVFYLLAWLQCLVPSFGFLLCPIGNVGARSGGKCRGENDNDNGSSVTSRGDVMLHFTPRPFVPALVDGLRVNVLPTTTTTSDDMQRVVVFWKQQQPRPAAAAAAAATAPRPCRTQCLRGTIRNMERPVTLMDKITFIPRWVIWQVIRFVTYVQRAIFRALVGAVAGFLTAVIIDPNVNRAFANALKDGLNLFLTQPTIKQRLLKFQENISENEPSLAKPIGEDFPKLLFNFLSGLILQGLDKDLGAKDTDQEMAENLK